ncbi:unnamed protein product [Victoria cruziana]
MRLLSENRDLIRGSWVFVLASASGRWTRGNKLQLILLSSFDFLINLSTRCSLSRTGEPYLTIDRNSGLPVLRRSAGIHLSRLDEGRIGCSPCWITLGWRMIVQAEGGGMGGNIDSILSIFCFSCMDHMFDFFSFLV